MMTFKTDSHYAQRVRHLRPSCIREIMKAAGNGEVISFAGGLPNPRLFPVQAVAEAADRVLARNGRSALQYSSSEGFAPLREYVAGVLLKKRNITAGADDVLLTSGSQQALDLVGKVFLEPGDRVLMENPAYLSAIQAFELYQPELIPLRMHEDGLDTHHLESCLALSHYKLAYLVPNFQNPTGRCYSAAVRAETAQRLRATSTVLVEDDPYRELRFEGEDLPPVHRHAGQHAVLLGSFSKLLSPGLRMGWVHAPPATLRHMTVAKQAADLCSSDFTQRILYELLTGFDLESHLHKLRDAYRRQRDLMLHCLETEFPDGTRFTRPQGGMFIWVELPGGVSAEALLAATSQRGVVFAPGRSFYPGPAETHTLRLNFTHAEGEPMRRGMQILGEELSRCLSAASLCA